MSIVRNVSLLTKYDLHLLNGGNEINAKDTGSISFSTVEELYEKIKNDDDLQIVDVRETSEFESEKIRDAISAPLSKFKDSSRRIDKKCHSYITCQSGKRAEKYAKQLLEKGHENISVVTGGLKSWIDAGYPIEKEEGKVWSLERQVRFTTGLLVLLGVVLSFVFNPMFLILSGAIGAGLVFAAVTDTCGIAMVLARMPWNQKC
ncbi:MAG: rhodanese-like domain-containing protein [Candidatus Scalindua sp.]|jgi:rhodanese-related sulfurtransferase|nr:rhodanese-like domain-containing protein [Candidatus Scalindua sp.]MBT6046350.1 rhodanese-like domain-containing protein [Candidatus Scalindua sp.]MBT6227711.1 rhodanese-like domain-containing protein [Candidatus Scalindua sp.]